MRMRRKMLEIQINSGAFSLSFVFEADRADYPELVRCCCWRWIARANLGPSFHISIEEGVKMMSVDSGRQIFRFSVVVVVGGCLNKCC